MREFSLCTIKALSLYWPLMTTALPSLIMRSLRLGDALRACARNLTSLVMSQLPLGGLLASVGSNPYGRFLSPSFETSSLQSLGFRLVYLFILSDTKYKCQNHSYGTAVCLRAI